MYKAIVYYKTIYFEHDYDDPKVLEQKIVLDLDDYFDDDQDYFNEEEDRIELLHFILGRFYDRLENQDPLYKVVSEKADVNESGILSRTVTKVVSVIPNPKKQILYLKERNEGKKIQY
jgi:hypothetical protein